MRLSGETGPASQAIAWDISPGEGVPVGVQLCSGFRVHQALVPGIGDVSRARQSEQSVARELQRLDVTLGMVA